MKDAHETRERDLESRILELKATVKDISQKNENLSSAYRHVESYKLNLVHILTTVMTKQGNNRHFHMIFILIFLVNFDREKGIEIILLIINLLLKC